MERLRAKFGNDHRDVQRSSAEDPIIAVASYEVLSPWWIEERQLPLDALLTC